MSTLDAVAWLAGAVEGPAAAEALFGLSRCVYERTMASRGKPVPGGPRLRADGLSYPDADLS